MPHSHPHLPERDGPEHAGHRHENLGWFGRLFHSHGHKHVHGAIDPGISSNDRGIWAVKWSFVILAVTSVLQMAVVAVSGSVALLADTIHNISDAATAVPLWIAFALARRKPSRRFTYGLGRVEDLAGLAVVLIILSSALVAGYQAVNRLIHPEPITELLWVTIAGIVGFLGNEAVAIFRIRVGNEINSAALIADGYHARTDGLTSLAVVAGAAGVWLGFPIADPVVGLLITIAILGIVWQSVKAVFTRMLDGVEPEVLQQLRHSAEHAEGVKEIQDVRARWIGHRLHAEMTLAFDKAMSIADINSAADRIRKHAQEELPALDRLLVQSRATA